MRVNAHLMEMTAVEGMMNYFSLLIYQMVWEKAEKKKDFVAVECGVSVGNSTVAILAGIARAGQGHLWSYDIQDNDTAIANVEKAGLTLQWTFLKENSLAAATFGPDENVDFLFLDTDHEYENTVKELAAWSPKIAPGGRMVLHDTVSRPEGVGKPFNEFVALNPTWKSYNIDVCCGLGVLIKP